LAGVACSARISAASLVGGGLLSLWEHIDTGAGRPIDFRQLGEVVARLHRVPAAHLREVVALPFCGDASWLAIERNLARAEAAQLVDADALAALRRACAALRGWQERARQDTLVVCHGDVHPRNVLMRGDEVVIVDWDAICLGPPAWDHAAPMTLPERWGGALDTYRDFARGYGADLRESPLARELATLRLLAPTINMILAGATNPGCGAEAETRLRYWLDDPAAPAWTPL
jgi:Ser/Thr protein kinase RdoA (MazF antagonist)